MNCNGWEILLAQELTKGHAALDGFDENNNLYNILNCTFKRYDVEVY